MSEYYPPNLKYVLNSLSGFSRMRNKLTLPFATAKANDIIFFKLPTNTMIDLSTLSFHYDLTTTSTGWCFPPQYSSCIIEQISIDINGITIQQIPMYNQIYKIMGNYTTGDQKFRNSFLENVGLTDVSPSGTAGVNGASFAIKQWLGLLGSNKIIDTSILGEITVSMRLVPNIAFMSSVTTSTYSLSSLSVQFDSCNLDNPVYQQSIYRQLEQGGLKWGFQNIITNFGGSSTLPVSQTFSVSTQSLDYLIGTILQADYNTAGNAYVQSASTSHYFNHGCTAAGTITNAVYQIGTINIPNFRCTIPEQLSYTLDSLGLNGDITGRSSENFKAAIGYNTPQSTAGLTNGGNSVAGLYSNYANGNYCFASKLCVGDKSNGPIISGLSTMGTNTTINFRVDGTSGSTAYIPLVFAVCTSVMTIGAGRQISLVI